MSIIGEVVDTVKSLVGGLAHTVSRIPQPKTTISYPEDPVPLSARFRIHENHLLLSFALCELVEYQMFGGL